MTARWIDGKTKAQNLRSEVKKRVDDLGKQGIVPRLDVLLVGDHAPSQIYVKYKQNAAAEIGIESHVHHLKQGSTHNEIQSWITRLNQDQNVHGILLQLPLPDHISSKETLDILSHIDPTKDVDGLHPLNQGLIGVDQTGFIACTPLGCMTLITQEMGDDLSGKSAVVIGRSRIVGRPMAQLLTAANATVTVCHSRTQNVSQYTKKADLIVVAAGVPHLLKVEDVKEGAVVIDVGIHRLEGRRLCGDVDTISVAERASAITPVPGGVGPMTIASLMNNVCVAAERILI
jgi:methylenetetrahydrofolate dehydrogenase (NADP+)/methenyltetrahydrofolate cyclohydrolase